MRIGFATDIHLDNPRLQKPVNYQGIGRFIAEGMDILLVGGDISNGRDFADHFRPFCEGARIPVYFVLGNHDFWMAPEAKVRETAASFSGYLDEAGVVELAPKLGLVGRTGWYDTLSGNPFESRIVMNDWDLVERLKGFWAEKHLLSSACRAWAEEETRKAREALTAAAKRYPTVLFVTHFPCFAATCWDEFGRPDTGESGWHPWSINTTMGHAILDVAEAFPETHITEIGRAHV